MPSNRSEGARRRWASYTPEQRAERGRLMRRALVVKEIRAQIEASRLEQGLPAHVVSEQFLQELSREVLGGGQDG